MQIDEAIVWSLIIILPVIIILGSSTNVALDEKFYEKQGFPYPTVLTDYLSGKSSSLDIKELNVGELSHMSDVKTFIGKLSTTYLVLLAIYTVLAVLLLFFSKNILESLIKFFYLGGIVANVAFLALILFVLTSFDSAFVRFHEIFFSQGNWAFPADSNLIKIFPESLFVAGFEQIILSSFLVSAIILLVGLLARYFKPNIYKALEQ